MALHPLSLHGTIQPLPGPGTRRLSRARLHRAPVELEDVDAWLAEESSRAALRVLGDQRPNLGLAQATLARDLDDLLLGVRRADVWVETGPAGEQRVRWDLRRADALELGCSGPSLFEVRV